MRDRRQLMDGDVFIDENGVMYMNQYSPNMGYPIMDPNIVPSMGFHNMDPTAKAFRPGMGIKGNKGVSFSSRDRAAQIGVGPNVFGIDASNSNTRNNTGFSSNSNSNVSSDYLSGVTSLRPEAREFVPTFLSKS